MDRVQVRPVGPVGVGASACADFFSHTDGWSILRKASWRSSPDLELTTHQIVRWWQLSVWARKSGAGRGRATAPGRTRGREGGVHIGW